MKPNTYDPAKMKQGLEAVTLANSEITTLLTTISTEVDTLMSSWKSDTSGIFLKVHDQWTAKGKEINTALSNLGLALSDTDKKYIANEAAQAASFLQLNGAFTPPAGT